MKKVNKNEAEALLGTMKVNGVNFVQTKVTRQAKRELLEFARTAEELIMSTQTMSPIITIPALANNVVVLEKAPQLLDAVKRSRTVLSKIHNDVAAINHAKNPMEYQFACLEISQKYVSWIQDYQMVALPLAAAITDEAMALEEVAPNENA